MMKYYFAILLLLVSINAHGALNKWVDAEGNVHYSDIPPAPDVKTQTLTPPSAPSDTPVQKSYIEREEELKKAQKTKEEAEQKAVQQQTNALVKQKNCEGAKANLRSFQSNAPIKTYNEKGESVIMDDVTRQQHIEEANRQINTYCGDN